MLNFKNSLVLFLVASVAFSGTITGTVTFEGKAPKRKKLKMNADPVCGSAHKSPVLDEKLILNDKNQIKNVMVRVKDGVLKRGMKIKLMSSGKIHQIDHVGRFLPKATKTEALEPGDIGYFTAAMKTVAETNVGDTITEEKNPAKFPLPGFKPSVPVVFSSLFPVDAAAF